MKDAETGAGNRPAQKDWAERSEARAWVMKFLYAFSQDGDPDAIEEWFEAFEVPPEHHDFIRKSLDSTLSRLDIIDAHIVKYVKGWDYSRMPKVDKAILRLAANEILFVPSIPVGVSINEAVELSKQFSGEQSYRFLNGILGNLARENDTV